jgi:hypothetical protein
MASALSKGEKALLSIAARVCTAIQYRDDNPDDDHDTFRHNLEVEMVRTSVIKINHFSNIFQANIRDAYKQYPQHSTTHRTHGALMIVGKEFQESVAQKREFDDSKLTTQVITDRCKWVKDTFPTWPPIFSDPDLSPLAMGQPSELHWWLPSQEDAVEGGVSFSVLI